jgi:membrane protease YdiL (CAAX protease family)
MKDESEESSGSSFILHPSSFRKAWAMQGQELRRKAVLLGVVFEGGLAVVALALGWLLDQPPLGKGFALTPAAVGLGVAASVPMIVLFLLIAHHPVGPFASLKKFFEEVIRPLFRDCTVWELALISLLAGLGEEMLFRGVLQGYAERWVGPWAALALASVVFGLFHPISLLYVALAAALGAYLGLVWMFADYNALVVIVTHAVYDFVLLVYLLRGPLAVPASPPAVVQSGKIESA